MHDKAPGATASRPSPPAAVLDVPNTKLVVSNVHYEVTPKDLSVSRHRTCDVGSSRILYYSKFLVSWARSFVSQ